MTAADARQRDPSTGRWLDGNRASVGNGGGGRLPKGRVPRKVLREAAATRALGATVRLQNAVADDIDTLIATLKHRAIVEGDSAALRTLLEYGLGRPAPMTRVELPELNGQPPDIALDLIHQAVINNRLPLEAAMLLSAIQRQRQEAQVLAPLRQVIASLRRGDPVEQVLTALAHIDVGDTIDGEVVNNHNPVQVVPDGQ